MAGRPIAGPLFSCRPFPARSPVRARKKEPKNLPPNGAPGAAMPTAAARPARRARQPRDIPLDDRRGSVMDL
ncbi:hypothetical protein A33M_0734 [Rhodovulum sp. PH10]|nr:hypothetical protein A33M_0734 [Rhodovulum sp. PH10]